VADIKLFGDDDDRVKREEPQPRDAVVGDERITKAPTTDRSPEGSRPPGRAR